MMNINLETFETSKKREINIQQGLSLTHKHLQQISRGKRNRHHDCALQYILSITTTSTTIITTTTSSKAITRGTTTKLKKYIKEA